MSPETFAARAQELAAAAGLPAVEALVEARPHAFLPGHRTYVEIAGGGDEPTRARVRLCYGSFQEAAVKEPGFDFERELERALGGAGERLAEDREAAAAMRDDEGLFEAHARFRRGLPVPPGWHRRGERLAEGAWVVDLDLFVEIVLRASEWAALGGQRVGLTVLDGELEIEVPAEGATDEVWTLEGCGLFESAPGVETEELEEVEGDELPGRYGDLHIVPYTF